MSKEEFLKIQTCVLKVNIHCEGCKQKVKKILHKIDGVYTTKIESELGKVTVSGNVDPATLIKKLSKNGKHAEIWGAPKPNNINNQIKNLQIDNGKGGNKQPQPQKGGAGGGGGANQPKGGAGGPGAAAAQNPPQNPQLALQQLQQMQNMQQMKGMQDLNLPPQFMKMPMGGNPNQKPAAAAPPPMRQLGSPEDEGLSDDEYDDEDGEFDDDDEEDYSDDDLDEAPLSRMKPVMANGQGGPQMPAGLLMNGMMMNGGANAGANAKKGGAGGGGGGGGGNVPVQMNVGGKKGGNVSGNQNQGGGKGGPQPQIGGGNGGPNKGGGASANMNQLMANGAMKGGGMNDGPRGMPNMMNAGGNVGHMPPIGGQMGNLPMNQMGNFASIPGMPPMNGGGGGAGYSQGGGGGGGGGGDPMAGNPQYQQQMAAMMMNQQRANGNERFQPMMYARPPPAVNYVPVPAPAPYQPYQAYPYPPPPGDRADQYALFSDENTSSCAVM